MYIDNMNRYIGHMRAHTYTRAHQVRVENQISINGEEAIYPAPRV